MCQQIDFWSEQLHQKQNSKSAEIFFTGRKGFFQTFSLQKLMSFCKSVSFFNKNATE
jgi:pantothenate kinase